MPRLSNISRTRKIATLVGVVALVGGGIALATGVSNAAESCAGLDTALQNNLNFIQGQKDNPDAQSEARIANRQAVVDLIQQRRQAAGCDGEISAQPRAGGNADKKQGSGESCAGLTTARNNNLNFIAGQRANPDAQSEARIANRQAVVDLIEQRLEAAGCDIEGAEEADGNKNEAPAEKPAEQPAEEPAEADDDADADDQDNTGGAGRQVCQGSTVTTTGSGGEGALSNQFPVGTRVRVTNTANNASIETEVVGGSGSCMLLQEGSFAPLRAFANNQLIRQPIVEVLD